MIYSSAVFLFLFLPLAIAIILIFRGVIKKNILTLLGIIALSSVYYFWAGANQLLWLAVIITVNLIIVKLIASFRDYARYSLALGILLNLGILVYFKYANFIINNLNKFLESNIQNLDIVAPLGISFIFFAAVSLLIEVYKDEKLNTKILGVINYLSFFPKISAGPISLYQDFAPQNIIKKIDSEDLYIGGKRFIAGLFKKVVIANNLGIVVDKIFLLDPSVMSTSLAWLVIITYGIQIYFDFSGYSDMAIGIARIFGYKLPENFNFPYFAKTATEFWRRWHMTLGEWFKRYVYFPLGGSRVEEWKIYRNIFIVFFLSGIWHGASWNYIIWGSFFGIVLMGEKLLSKFFFNDRFRFILHPYLLFTVLISWVFFRSPSISYALDLFSTMFSQNQDAVFYITDMFNQKTFSILIFGIIFSFPFVFKFAKNLITKTFHNNDFVRLGVDFGYLVLLIFTITHIANSTYQPFIYLQF